jgi:hypothetical protein
LFDEPPPCREEKNTAAGQFSQEQMQGFLYIPNLFTSRVLHYVIQGNVLALSWSLDELLNTPTINVGLHFN